MRFQLRRALADAVDDPADVDAELAYVLDVLARSLGRNRPADETVGVAMNSAYLPNAILCLVVRATPPDGPRRLPALVGSLFLEKTS